MKASEGKKIRPLEKSLMKALVDPPDSDQRRRYVKRWIYGEGNKLKAPKSFLEKIKEVLNN